jgi:hypothetical protein
MTFFSADNSESLDKIQCPKWYSCSIKNDGEQERKTILLEHDKKEFLKITERTEMSQRLQFRLWQKSTWAT